jgi:hypothetical protein
MGKKTLLSLVEVEGFIDRNPDKIYDFKAYDPLLKTIISRNVYTFVPDGTYVTKKVKVRMIVEIEEDE